MAETENKKSNEIDLGELDIEKYLEMKREENMKFVRTFAFMCIFEMNLVSQILRFHTSKISSDKYLFLIILFLLYLLFVLYFLLF